MRNLLFAGLLLAIMPGCKKGDINPPAGEQSLVVQLNSFEPYQYEAPADSVVFGFSARYSKAFRPGEDSANKAKQANDLSIYDGGQDLYKDGLPYAADSIPLRMARLIGTEYKIRFVFPSAFPSDINVYLVEKYGEGETGTNFTIKKYLMRPNANEKIFYNDNPTPALQRFSVMFEKNIQKS